MGTAGCIAEIDVNGHLTIWAKTQIPFLAQRDFIRALWPTWVFRGRTPA